MTWFELSTECLWHLKHASPEHSNSQTPGQGESTAQAQENLKFSCSEVVVCGAELQPYHML